MPYATDSFRLSQVRFACESNVQKCPNVHFIKNLRSD